MARDSAVEAPATLEGINATAPESARDEVRHPSISTQLQQSLYAKTGLKSASSGLFYALK
jgi:hypothetical protein